MPRQRKTQSGAPAQPASPIPGQTYGMGVQQQRLAEQMPAPQAAPPAPAPAPQSQAPQGGPTPVPIQGGTSPSPAVPADPFAGLKGRLGVMTQPTMRPDEPVTAGLRSGPGAGPEILARPVTSPLGDQMRHLSQILGDPSFANLAAKSGI